MCTRIQHGTLNQLTFFLENKSLDVAIVALDIKTDDEVTWRPIPLHRDPIIMQENECFSIIQHPDGGAKRVALRGWKMKCVSDEGFIQYETDTLPGSSGSPVFNDFWQLVAVHHSANTVKIANQGTHVNDIINWIIKSMANLTKEQQDLVAKLIA